MQFTPSLFQLKTMNRPTTEDEKELMSINDNDATIVSIPRSKKKFKVRWIKPYTCERITKLALANEKNKAVTKRMIGEGEGAQSVKEISSLSKFSSKLASLCLLNGMKIFFFHWIYWRWMYYVKGYDYKQLEPIIETAKKK